MARKGRSVKSARALAFLFASGILTSSEGKGGKGRTVKYNRERAQAIRKAAGKGSPSGTFRKKASTGAGKGAGNTRNGPDKFQRTAIQGKAAHLRSGSGSGKPGRTVPSKAERDATRAERIMDGRWHAEDKLRSMIPGGQRERFNAASVMHAQSSPSAQRQGWSEIKGIAKGLSQKRKSTAEASRTRARRLTAVTNGQRTRAEKKRAAYNPLF